MIFSSQLGKLDGQTNEQAMKSIANHLRKIQEELEYRLANLDSSNVTEIDTDTTTMSGGIVTLISETEDTVAQLQVTDQQIQARITNEVTGLNSKITQTESNFTSQISDTNGNVSKLSQSLSSIKLSVENGDTSSYIGVMLDGVVVSSADIVMKGLVTFQGLNEGTTTIDGACIKTGTIKAEYLDLSGVATISGLSGGTTTIDGSCIKTGTIDAKRIDVDNLSVDAAQITGLLSADKIKLGGNMTMYQSLDSTVSAGTIGYTRITSVDSSSSWYQAYALGIISDYHAVLAAPSGNLLVMSAGDMYIGSQLNGLIEMTCSDLRINGKAVMDRLTRFEAAFNALGVTFSWSNDG